MDKAPAALGQDWLKGQLQERLRKGYRTVVCLVGWVDRSSAWMAVPRTRRTGNRWVAVPTVSGSVVGVAAAA